MAAMTAMTTITAMAAVTAKHHVKRSGYLYHQILPSGQTA